MDRNTLISVFSIVGGVLAIIFRDSFARQLMEVDEQLGWWIKGKSTLGSYTFLIVLISMLFIFAGVSELLGIISFR